MKKSMLNFAISMALSGAAFSGSVLSTQASAEDLSITPEPVNNNETSENYMLPGIGAGAATGAIIAGPAGLLIGGVIGGIIGTNQDSSPHSDNSLTATTDPVLDAINDTTPVADNTPYYQTDSSLYNAQEPAVHVARIGQVDAVADETIGSQQEKIMNILVTDLSLDVYFRSGSTDIEKFYPSRLTAIAGLMQTMDELELHLDGYTDRRGDQQQNIALANDRIEKVRQQLIRAGVEENRIVSKAFGEAKMKSTAGDLEAYTFDRRVVIRFERIASARNNTVANAVTGNETTQATMAKPVVADASTRF